MTAPRHLSNFIDFIDEVLKNFKNDLPTLFKCLLINRTWCTRAVPLLYEKPFENILYDAKPKRNFDHINPKKYSITWTLILCFDKTELSYFNSEFCKKKINIDFEYKPLFEYPKYIKYFDDAKINEIILQWCYLSNSVTFQSREQIFPIFHHSILRQCNRLKRMNITFPFTNFGSSTEFVKNLTPKLSDLNFLSLKHNNFEKYDDFYLEFLKNLSYLNITNLHIETPTKEISSIIKKQKDLKVIQLAHCENMSILSNLFSELLEFQKYSLVYIEFYDVNFQNISFDDFVNLSNLLFLTFIKCKNITSDQVNIFNFTSFKLKELKIHSNEMEPHWMLNRDNHYRKAFEDDVKASVIKYLGKSLQRLIIVEVDNIDYRIFKAIKDYCLDLTTLDINLGYEIDFPNFTYLSKLRIRKFNIVCPITRRHMRDALYLVADNLPITVKELSIGHFWLINDFDFAGFLKHCHDYLDILNLEWDVTSPDSPYAFENLEMMLNYIEKSKNNLKLVGIKNSTSELLDEFKDKSRI